MSPSTTIATPRSRLRALSVVIGLMLALLGVFVFLTSPTATHAVANAAYKSGLKPLLTRYRPHAGSDDGGAA